MEYKLSTIPLGDINIEDDTFRITTTQDKLPLRDSIQKVGLLQPPAIWCNPTDPIVVSGFRRIMACQEVGLHAIPVRLVSSGFRPLDCLRMAITENITQRSLNLVETARAVRRVMDHCPSGHNATDELVLLGLPTSRAMITKFDRLRQLPTHLQDAIVEGTIGLNTALEIGVLKRPDQMVLHRIFRLLRPSVGKQKEILRMAREIAGREKKSIASVLQTDEVGAIVDDDQIDRNLKTTMLRRHLKKIRYPYLTSFEARYQLAVSSLQLGPQMRIDPPAYFEGSTFTLAMRFANRRDLEEAYRKIGNILKKTAIDAIFTL